MYNWRKYSLVPCAPYPVFAKTNILLGEGSGNRHEFAGSRDNFSQNSAYFSDVTIEAKIGAESRKWLDPFKIRHKYGILLFVYD